MMQTTMFTFNFKIKLSLNTAHKRKIYLGVCYFVSLVYSLLLDCHYLNHVSQYRVLMVIANSLDPALLGLVWLE